MYIRPDERYPLNWNRLRGFVFKRDGYTCQRCRRKVKSPDCHHIRPVGKGGNHHPSNLVTVCRNCHKKIHEG